MTPSPPRAARSDVWLILLWRNYFSCLTSTSPGADWGRFVLSCPLLQGAEPDPSRPHPPVRELWRDRRSRLSLPFSRLNSPPSVPSAAPHHFCAPDSSSASLPVWGRQRPLPRARIWDWWKKINSFVGFFGAGMKKHEYFKLWHQACTVQET